MLPRKLLTVSSSPNTNLVLGPMFGPFSLSKTMSATSFTSPIHQTLHSHLEICSTMKQINQIHAQIIANGLLEESLTVGKLIALCVTSIDGNLPYARLLFDQVAEPNRFMWNSLIRGYSNSNTPREAIVLYHKMVGTGHSPNDFTFPFVFKACAIELASVETLMVQVQVIKLGFVSQVFVQNALLHAYAVLGKIVWSRKVFDDMPDKNTVTWNSMIGGYSQRGFWKEAFSLFQVMRGSGLVPDEFTFVYLLWLCSQMGHFEFGQILHVQIETSGMGSNLFVNNALLDMYAKCRHLASAKVLFDNMREKNVISWTSMVSAYGKVGLTDVARHLFDQMAEKNVVSWNAMVSSYVQHGQCQEALDLYAQMQNSTEKPDEATMVSIIRACSQIGDLTMGKKIHHSIPRNMMFRSVTLFNSLVDMYAKCGPLSAAVDLFHQIPGKNVVSWNVMIGAFALHGFAYEAINSFMKMCEAGFSPDSITFVGVLTACSHGGLLAQGQVFFDAMNQVYGLPHEVQHYACMVDLLGRTGRLQEAVSKIVTMPMMPDAVVWGALLGACRVHGNVFIALQLLKRVLELEPYAGGLFVLLSNILSEANRWDDVKKVRILMRERGIPKVKALSLIEINGIVHEFLVEDRRHEYSSCIYALLDALIDHMVSMGKGYDDEDDTVSMRAHC